MNSLIHQMLSYDAWGRLRDPDTHEVYAFGDEPSLRLGRGYCGHEYLPMFGLVNMNARLYDPQSGRFLAPDPVIQTPDNPQNFNRYAYCLNNPLRYIDLTGMARRVVDERSNYDGDSILVMEDDDGTIIYCWFIVGTMDMELRIITKKTSHGSSAAGDSDYGTPNYGNLPEAANTIAGGLGASNGVTTTLIDNAAKGVPEYSGYVKGAKAVGTRLTIINIGYSTYNLVDNYISGELTQGKIIKYGCDVLFGVLSLSCNPVGVALSGVYFILDVATDGFDTNKE